MCAEEEKMVLDLNLIKSNLVQGEDGIWRTDGTQPVSYPDEAHNAFFSLENKSFWFRHRAKCIIQAIRNYPPEGMLLDVGGGNGYMTQVINAAGFDCALVEPGEKGVRNAAKRGIKPLICASLEEAGFSEHTIPAIGTFDVIEHIEDDARFLSLLHQQLIPRGRLYLTVPAFDFLWSREDEMGGHFRRYTLSKMRAKLFEAGFDVLYETYFFSFLPVPIYLFRALPTRLGMGPESTQERRSSIHAADNAKRSALVEKWFSWETQWIKRKKTLPLGGSCLVVASAREVT